MSIRLAEVVAALSVATDFGMGQPAHTASTSCVVAVRLGAALGFDDDTLRDVYYEALLRYVGCNAETHDLAALVGDELVLRRDFAVLDTADVPAILRLFTTAIRRAHAGESTYDVVRAVARGLLGLTSVKDVFAGHCEVAQRLAGRLGLESSLVTALGQLYERWDGKGAPHGLKGEAISPAVLVVTLAQDAVLFHRMGGVDAAVRVARQRRGRAYAPDVVDTFCRDAARLLDTGPGEPSWDAVLALEPGPHRLLDAAGIDGACQAMADFADLKSSYTLGHARGVSALSVAAAKRAGLPDDDVTQLGRAAWVHDIGRTGVSTGVWDKTTVLSDRDWEQIRLHTYYTERILARAPALAAVAAVAAAHHERCDASGYHRGVPGRDLSPAARILCAADVYHAAREPRPHRPARTADAAAQLLRDEARAGRLDGEAVRCVLAAAGHRSGVEAGAMVGGLSAREIEVLRLLARGNSTKAVARALGISPKTADHHIQHIYGKIDVSTRAGATLFAVEHNLMGPEPR